MAEIPVEAQVECVDGPCGESVTVIADPVARKITHIVVQDPEGKQRLVPVDQIAESSHDKIRLSCRTEDLAAMEPFTEAHYVKVESPDYAPAYYGYYGGGAYGYEMPYASYAGASLPVLEERIPPGELAIDRWSRVEASDGHIGRVSEFIIEPGSGHITHLVLMEGHLWGRKEVTIPVAAVDRVEGDTVFLKLDKEAIEQLPAIPVKRHHGKDDAYPRTTELVARVFDDPDKANEALDYVEELHRQKVFRIHNAAVLVKHEDGTASVTDTRDLDPKRSRVIGAIAGGLLGLVGGPVGAAVGALAGAGAGSLGAKWIDKGFSDKFLAGFQEHLRPGSSALIVLVEQDWVHPMSESLADLGGVVFQQTLSDELARNLLKTSESME